MRFQPLSRGATMWSDEQSRKHFEAVQKEVLPGVPLKSRLLIHPPATDAGGDRFHSGGEHWTSQNDPQWQVLAAWVNGKPMPAGAPTSAAAASSKTSPVAALHGPRIIHTNSAGDWSMIFDNGVRPITFDTNPDASAKQMFVQISELHGFAVVDFATHQEVRRITLPDVPGVKKNTQGAQGLPSHGIGITPDGKTSWVTSEWYGYVFAYSMPDLTLLGSVPVGRDPDWLTFSPDGKSVYVACAASDWVSVVDVKTIKEVTRIPIGFVPKRNITAVFP